MIKGQYKKILWEVFDVLAFFSHEKEKALEGFKRKFAGEMLRELQSSFSAEQNQWIAQAIASKEYDKNDPIVHAIQKKIDSDYPKEELDRMGRRAFKRILTSYVSFMSQKVDPEKVKKLNRIVADFDLI